VEIALRKRPIQSERIERMVSGIVRQLESMGEQEMPSSVIGELIMEALKGLDPRRLRALRLRLPRLSARRDFHEVWVRSPTGDQRPDEVAGGASPPAARRRGDR
jgi:transcriptional repressor NrdR